MEIRYIIERAFKTKTIPYQWKPVGERSLTSKSDAEQIARDLERVTLNYAFRVTPINFANETESQ